MLNRVSGVKGAARYVVASIRTHCQPRLTWNVASSNGQCKSCAPSESKLTIDLFHAAATLVPRSDQRRLVYRSNCAPDAESMFCAFNSQQQPGRSLLLRLLYMFFRQRRRMRRRLLMDFVPRQCVHPPLLLA